MSGEPEVPQDAGPADDGGLPVPGRRVWRWVAPIAVAVAVLAAVAGSRPLVDYGSEPYGQARMPRFLVTAGGSVATGTREGTPRDGVPPWFQVHGIGTGTQRLVDSVLPPSPSAGEVQEIVTGPGGMFVVAAWRAEPCESRLYRFRLTGDGRATDITPVNGGLAPGLVAGLAISPDSRRIAYATAQCADDRSISPHGTPPAVPLPPRAADASNAVLTVLDIATGDRRTWTASQTSVIGGIVWARDSRTLGYITSDVSGATIGNVTVRALDTDAPGSDLAAGRTLLRVPDGVGTVTSAVMDPDGRSGYGTMQKGQPPSIIVFSFTEGRPMHVVTTIPTGPKGVEAAVSIATDGRPRYACLSGIDAFGRVSEGTVAAGSRGFGQCGVAYAWP